MCLETLSFVVFRGNYLIWFCIAPEIEEKNKLVLFEQILNRNTQLCSNCGYVVDQGSNLRPHQMKTLLTVSECCSLLFFLPPTRLCWFRLAALINLICCSRRIPKPSKPTDCNLPSTKAHKHTHTHKQLVSTVEHVAVKEPNISPRSQWRPNRTKGKTSIHQVARETAPWMLMLLPISRMQTDCHNNFQRTANS